MERWAGTTAVVTGASSGIGAAVCVRLADAGLRVVGVARRTHLIDELSSKVSGRGSITSRACDVSQADQVAELFQWVEQHYGGTDVLVNNAGIYYAGSITEAGPSPVTEEQVLATIDVNLKGVVLCARRAAASLTSRARRGHIINVSSISGHYIPFNSFLNVYPATKHGVSAFSQILVNELSHARSQIKVTDICPGLVATGMSLSADDKPILQPADVADAALYALATPPNVNITQLTIQPVMELRI